MWRPMASTLRRDLPTGSKGLSASRNAAKLCARLFRTSSMGPPATCTTHWSPKKTQAKDDRRAGWHWAALASGSGLALGLITIESNSDSNQSWCSSTLPIERDVPREVIIATATTTPAQSTGSRGEMVDISQTHASSTAGTRGHEHSSCRQGQERAVAFSLASEYNANGPIEDRYDVQESPRGDFFAAVYDGHGGWQAAEFARKRLSIAARTELNNSLAKSVDQIKGALTHAFLRVEREYLYRVKTAFELGFGAVAKTGSCAIMALIREDKLFVANAGDCRAVLGRRRRQSTLGWGGGGGDGVMEAVALSNDHNAREKTEQEKLRRLHPSEEDIVKCKRSNACYVKGRLQPTRSLGDAYLKYSEFNGRAGMHSSAGRFMPPPYTPPYITAEPEIHVHKIDTTQDEFVVLASDGLWDYVSSAEAVEIVQKVAYIDRNPAAAGDQLIQSVLERAAARYNMTVESLKSVQEGPGRRCKHDDVTCIVFFFQGNEKNEGFGALGASLAGNESDSAQDDEEGDDDDDDDYHARKTVSCAPPAQ